MQPLFAQYRSELAVGSHSSPVVIEPTGLPRSPLVAQYGHCLPIYDGEIRPSPVEVGHRDEAELLLAENGVLEQRGRIKEGPAQVCRSQDIFVPLPHMLQMLGRYRHPF